jgi:hypothetical protein
MLQIADKNLINLFIILNPIGQTLYQISSVPFLISILSFTENMKYSSNLKEFFNSFLDSINKY